MLFTYSNTKMHIFFSLMFRIPLLEAEHTEVGSTCPELRAGTSGCSPAVPGPEFPAHGCSMGAHLFSSLSYMLCSISQPCFPLHHVRIPRGLFGCSSALPRASNSPSPALCSCCSSHLCSILHPYQVSSDVSFQYEI